MVSGRDMLSNDARLALARGSERKRERQEYQLAKLQHALANTLLEHGMLDHEAIRDSIERFSSGIRDTEDFTSTRLKKMRKHAGTYALALEVQVGDQGSSGNEPNHSIESISRIDTSEVVVQDSAVASPNLDNETNETNETNGPAETLGHEPDKNTSPREESPPTVIPSPAQVAAMIVSRPKVDKQPEAPEPLAKLDRNRLERLAGPKTEELLKLSSTRDIAYSIWQMMGEPLPFHNQQGYTPDFVERIRRYLEAVSYKEIAADEHTTDASVSQWFTNQVKKLHLTSAGKPQAPSWGGVEHTPESEAPIADAIPEQKIDTLSLIEDARNVPHKLSDQEHADWENAAVSLIGERMRLAGFTQEDTDVLWRRIHADQGGLYKMDPNDEEATSLKKLYSYFLEHGRKHLQEKGLVRENIIVNYFLNPLGHYKNLDEVHARAGKVKGNFYTDHLTLEKTQYYAAHGFIKLLEQDGNARS